MIPVSSGAARRSGRSLVEALVVIGILGLLMALVLPAVQQARAAARLSCQNRLRQIGLGLHGHHDTHGAFPVGEDRSPFGAGAGSLQGVSWLAKILPFVDQQPLWEQTRQPLARDRVPWNNPPHVGLATVIPIYICPSDSRVASPQRGPDGILAAYTSYHGVRGEDPFIENGVFPLGYAVRFADITDGTSHTAIVGERSPSARLDSGWWYATHLSAYSHDFILSAEMHAEGFVECVPLDGWNFVFGPGRIDNQCDLYHFWSLHTGGANFCFADGSVRFLAYSISPKLRALASRNGGEVVDVP